MDRVTAVGLGTRTDGIPVYGFLKAGRERLGQIEETVDMPPKLADASPQRANT